MDADAVIVGAGAGGAACAWALARHGLRVLALEAGPSYDPRADYRLDRLEWEQSRFPAKTPPGRYTLGSMQELDPAWQSLRSWTRGGGPTNPSDYRLPGSYHHVRGVGGSTLHFAGEAHRLHPAAMQMRTRFGVAADWPLTYAELEPFYCEAERVVGVAGPAQDPVRVRSEPCPLSPHPLSYASTKLAAGCRTLGLTWVPSPVAALSAAYEGRPPCNYCGNCLRGCPIGDKGSADVTFARKALASGRVTIATGCEVVHLEAGPDDRVAGVQYVDGTGATRRATGRVVVLAAGAVETPRLLLASRGRHAPDGLANESGQVGKNCMETLAWTSAGLHPDPLDSFRGLPSDSGCWDFNAPDAIPGVVGGCRFAPGTAEADLVGPINYARRVAAGWGHSHKQEMRRLFGHALAVKGIAEWLPGPRSYVDLDPRQRDRHGVPLARIHSHLDDMAIRRLAFMAGKTREILKAAGVQTIFEESGTYDVFNASYFLGTCRMGHDPKSAVVDRFGRSHRWQNLYLADASVFPSSGGGEAPSLTIEALAIRTAGAIRRALAGSG